MASIYIHVYYIKNIYTYIIYTYILYVYYIHKIIYIYIYTATEGLFTICCDHMFCLALHKCLKTCECVHVACTITGILQLTKRYPAKIGGLIRETHRSGDLL